MRRLLSALFVLLVLVPAGCSDDTEKPIIVVPHDPYRPYHERTTIDSVLFNLKLSYNKRNIEEYKKLLHSEFTNVFSPGDVGGLHSIPQTWGYADEVACAANLFGHLPNADGYRCETISLGFSYGADVPSELGEGWRKVTLMQVQLNVDARHKDNGEQLIYQVLGDQADLFFVQTEEVDQHSGTHLWRIIRWVDKPVGLKAATKSTTWGRIKGSWR